jgi:hypothetical protein
MFDLAHTVNKYPEKKKIHFCNQLNNLTADPNDENLGYI